MSQINRLRKNIFLLLFFTVSILFGYGIINEKESFIYLFKPFIIISLFIHYIKRVKQVNLFFVAALVFAFIGDLLFTIGTNNTALLAMSSFLVFNLLLMIIAAEKAGVIKPKKLLVAMAPFAMLFLFVVNRFFDNIGEMKLLITIFGFIVVLLCSFSLNTFIKNRNKESLFFLIGALFFTAACVGRGVKQFSTSFSLFYISLLSIISYVFSLFFFCKSLLLKKEKNKANINSVEIHRELEFNG